MRGHITKRGKNSYSIVLDIGTDRQPDSGDSNAFQLKEQKRTLRSGFPNYCTSLIMAFSSGQVRLPFPNISKDG